MSQTARYIKVGLLLKHNLFTTFFISETPISIIVDLIMPNYANLALVKLRQP